MPQITFNYRGSDVTYGIIKKTYNEGEPEETTLYWLDRNLGASRVPTSRTDSEGYGDLFQWGRLSDGHQDRDAETKDETVDNNNPGHGDFIITSSHPYDWRNPQNNDLWQGVNGINNPSPPGWQIPTEDEIMLEVESWSDKGRNEAYSSTDLKFPTSGWKEMQDGLVNSNGIVARYWTAGIGTGTSARGLIILSSDAYCHNLYRAMGYSVRCVTTLLEKPTVTTESAFEIKDTSFEISGKMTNSGGMDADELGFVYMEGTSGDPTISNNKVKDDNVAGGKGEIEYDKEIDGLVPGTSYRVRAYATNDEGTSYGDTITVTTEGSHHEFYTKNLNDDINIAPSKESNVNYSKNLNFPTSLDKFNNPGGNQKTALTKPTHSEHHRNHNEAIETLQEKVGVDNSNVETSHDYKIRNAEPIEYTNTYFVSKEGSDTNTGKQTNKPFLTIGKALEEATFGTRIKILDNGAYQENLVIGEKLFIEGPKATLRGTITVGSCSIITLNMITATASNQVMIRNTGCTGRTIINVNRLNGMGGLSDNFTGVKVIENTMDEGSLILNANYVETSKEGNFIYSQETGGNIEFKIGKLMLGEDSKGILAKSDTCDYNGVIAEVSDKIPIDPEPTESETIYGDASDSMVRYRSDTGATEIFGLTDTSLHIGQRTNNGNELFNVGVIVFQLPEVPPGKEIDEIKLRIAHAGRDGISSINYDVDLRGIRHNSNNTVLTSDYADSGELLQESIITPDTTPPVYIETNNAGTTNLTNWIKDLYDNGAEAGDYVFIKLQFSEEPDDLNNINSYRILSGDNTENDNKPQLLVEYSGEAEPPVSNAKFIEMDNGEVSIVGSKAVVNTLYDVSGGKLYWNILNYEGVEIKSGGFVYKSVSDNNIAVLENKRLKSRVFEEITASSLTPDLNNYDRYFITGLTEEITINEPIGEPSLGETIAFYFKDTEPIDTEGHQINWNSIYKAVGQELISETTGEKWLETVCTYNGTNWLCTNANEI